MPRRSRSIPKLPDHLCHSVPRPEPPPPPVPKPGDRIRFTGKFLASTMAGGLDVWTVVACACPPCAEGRWVATDEVDEWGRRHVAVANVCLVGALDWRNCP